MTADLPGASPKKSAARRRGRTGRGWDASPGRAPRDTPDDEEAHRSPAGSTGSGEVDEAERAREICLRLLAVRPRTHAELARALRRRGISDEVAARVLERYREVGMVDDRLFARAWVTSRHHGRGLARRALAVELRRKGIDAEIVGDALAELDPETEARTARQLVDRKLLGGLSGPPEATFRRLVGMLARKGYPPSVAIRVTREALAERTGTAALDAAEDWMEIEAADADRD